MRNGHDDIDWEPGQLYEIPSDHTDHPVATCDGATWDLPVEAAPRSNQIDDDLNPAAYQRRRLK